MPENNDESILKKTKDQILNKAEKVEASLDAVIARQFSDIADDEIATVQQYRDQKLNLKTAEASQSRGGDRDIIICDDMRIEVPQPQQSNGIAKTLLGLAAGAGIAGPLAIGGMLLLDAINSRDTKVTEKPGKTKMIPGTDKDVRVKGIKLVD